MAEKKKKEEGFSLLKLLGAGMAAKAGRDIEDRKKDIDEEIRAAVSGSMRKKVKK